MLKQILKEQGMREWARFIAIRTQWRTIPNKVIINLRAPQKAGNFMTEWLQPSQDGELVKSVNNCRFLEYTVSFIYTNFMLKKISIFTFKIFWITKVYLFSVATGWRIGGFESRKGLGIFLFTTVSRTALGATQPPIQWVPRALSLGVKRPGCEADHSPPSSTNNKNAWSYTSSSPVRLHGVVLS
jgi:hypothetical protein